MKLSTRLLQLNPSARRLHGLTVGLGALASAVVVAQALVLSRVISRVFLGGQTLNDVALLLLALAALALARAFLKDAPILILDEPTAYLDAHTEQELLRSLGPLMDRRTTLMITHRLVGLEIMDTILVLDRGRIVEQGKHHDLLLRGGHYRRMWERQHTIERLVEA